MAATFSLKVDARSARKALEKLDRDTAGRIISDRLLRATAEAVQGRAQLNLRDNGTNATFRLTRSWRITEPILTRESLVVRLSNSAPYAAFVEFGTKASGAAAALPRVSEEMRREQGYTYGLGPSPLPPLDKIGAWVAVRGLPEEATFPIALKIAREGIPPQPFLGPAVEVEVKRSRGRIRDTVRRMLP